MNNIVGSISRKGLVIGAVAAAVVFALGHKVGFKSGYGEAHEEYLSTVAVKHVDAFTVDSKRMITATVESIKAQSKLVSFMFRGTQTVSVDREAWGAFHGIQRLTIPTQADYFLDLEEFKDSDCRVDETAKTISVELPPLMVQVHAEPLRAIEINEGTLTMSDDVVQELRNVNLQQAYKSAIAQAQQPEFVEIAKKRAIDDISALFRTPLAAVGMGEWRVKVALRRYVPEAVRK